MEDIEELKRQGMSIHAISRLTGMDRKTITKYLKVSGIPKYGPRPTEASKLDQFKPLLEERMKAGVWNARVIMRELRERGYVGSYTILTDWLRPQRESTHVTAVGLFETPLGGQAQAENNFQAVGADGCH